ncbi:MAG TPA: HAD-IIIA family hydrolase [Flavobacteriales bacterium]|nr:HAD-IIIA family hydrolase [Flavobacteriales bacterium]HNU58148.1 HAD-IIIA family hydrolase [Flavobacteriales bacterium]
MKKGLFLDRDGVINRELGTHTTSLADFDILPGTPEAITAAVAAGWVVVVITNQSGIGLGMYDHAAVAAMHERLRSVLRDAGTEVADILYCPHHPQQGRCLCRKPGSLLLERAAARHGIDLAASVMIGDRQRDVDAANGAGARGILVAPDRDLMDTLRTNGLL